MRLSYIPDMRMRLSGWRSPPRNSSGVAVLFGTDAHGLIPRDGKKWKIGVKKCIWPRLFRLADVVIVPSSASVQLIRSLKIPEDRTCLTPYCVDNEWWIEKSKQVDRASVRARWGVGEDAIVVLFCAKLQPWKRPHDLLPRSRRPPCRTDTWCSPGMGRYVLTSNSRRHR